MSVVSDYLREHWEELGLASYGSADALSCLTLTPRFQASSHLIVMVFVGPGPDPVLFVKLPRLPGDCSRLDREAANLRQVHTARPEGFGSIPRLVEYAASYHWPDHPMLIETAVSGDVMRPTLVRRDPDTCVEAGLRWLLELHGATARPSATAPHWFAAATGGPLARLEGTLSAADERELVARARELIRPLEAQPLPLVFEHGDCSAPNVLLGARGVSVVDWELADPTGVAGADLFFFLTFVAFAREAAETTAAQRRAFEAAFFGADAWAPAYVTRYAASLGLTSGQLVPLFVLCWCRYLSSIIERVGDASETTGSLSDTALTWLRDNRYYWLWRDTITRANALRLTQ